MTVQTIAGVEEAHEVYDTLVKFAGAKAGDFYRESFVKGFVKGEERLIITTAHGAEGTFCTNDTYSLRMPKDEIAKKPHLKRMLLRANDALDFMFMKFN